ncbi:nickel-dependent hydrogenase large subunit [Methanosalsum zhilinae DSM 4017]|uniref:Nickel-dependent hydrogenase large subunit n=1 Tax=Methanosalsum zhilinae (strain DSM 4017 / NBRC 107636 / OCM 62 / WeN5) TaxID=679901 RepID=F7XLB9_METZD|nr:nickel-dependent hydrogenase large subunit [Methanosalsum zhilinae]AEH60776.1 nickel-dependent hydrogenase large subunit [Methanosalsum zhilinae DSM 4017]
MVRVTIDPLTRIGGGVRLDTEVSEQGTITTARVSNMDFRGFERIFQYEDPRDAALLSQRICGACPVAHSIASSSALDDLFGVAESVPKDALVMRNILQAMETVANNALHTYIMWTPDLLNPSYRDILTEFSNTGVVMWKELLKRFAPINYSFRGVTVEPGRTYLDILSLNRSLHEAGGILGGKMPHQVVNYPGGLTAKPEQSKVNKVSSIIADVNKFFNTHTTSMTFQEWLDNTYRAPSSSKAISFFLEHLEQLTEKFHSSSNSTDYRGWGDLELYSVFCSELIGEQILGNPVSFRLDKIGGYSDLSQINFLSYGGYYNVDHEGYDPENPQKDRFQNAGIVKGTLSNEKFDVNKIGENVSHSFYKDDDENYRNPFRGVTEPYSDPDTIDYNDFSKKEYTFSKAPRYDGIPCEVGPQSRLLVMEEPLIKGLAKMFLENGYSPFNTFTRVLARLHELMIIISELDKWINVDLDLNGRYNVNIDMDDAKDSRGMGLWEAGRGSLGHWIVTGNDAKVVNYQVDSPTTWNLSPRDSRGIPGPLEQALENSCISAVENFLGPCFDNPTGILHTGRSYDPCISCAVQTIDLTGKKSPANIRIS